MLDFSMLNEIMELASGDDDMTFVSKLIGIFMENSPVRMTKMREAILAGDAKSLAYEAHTIKSSAANLGASILTDIAKDLETMGKSGTLTPDAKVLMAKFDSEYQVVTQELNAFVSEKISQQKKAA